ncbi:PH domain-containing protein [Bacillus sp. JCM 19041]|uniref:PH domain-containing protein n=1 Tax=Bacillus sp. JCM 19041 TaxID=1460637 RepID=UPI000A4E1584
MKAKRYHPLQMLFGIVKLGKNIAFIALFLFVFRAGSDSTFIAYAKIIFFILIGSSLVSIFVKWVTHKYELDDRAFHLYKGLFTKSERIIPFSKVQNVNRHTSFLHKPFRMTSIHFETGMTGEDAAITFQVVSEKEADQIEKLLTNRDLSVRTSEENTPDKSNVENESHTINETIYFRSTRRDLLKASFASLSFLLLIPLIGSLLFKINDMTNIEEETKGILTTILNSWWLLTGLIAVIIIASVIYGVLKTVLTYGNYTISSDDDRIHIKKGVLSQTSFSISKEKVQAIEINQSLIKRMLGLCEVKLISAGSLNIDDQSNEISTLYPFLPIEQAYDMVTELLPTYDLTTNMKRLPKKALAIRILRPYWAWLIASAFSFISNQLFYKTRMVGGSYQLAYLFLLLLLEYSISLIRDTY